jgi:hypothetical protein
MAFIKGYESNIELVIEGATSQTTARYVSHVRDIDNIELLAVMSTDNGRIVVLPDDIVRFTLPASETAKLRKEFIFDFSRVDGSEPIHYGFIIKDELFIPTTRD